MSAPALLVLEDGTVFHGQAIGALGQTVGEVVFNTAMTGYQEILTDPSYHRQMVTLTYPHIGNTGTTPEDDESARAYAAGLIIRDLPPLVSNWRSRESLPDYLLRHGIVAISAIDTRKLTRILREKGALNGCIQAGDVDEASALAAAREFPGIKGMDLAREVTTRNRYEWLEGTWQLGEEPKQVDPDTADYHVVAYDFGMKQNILRMLADRGCRVTVVPAETTVDEVMELKPDGIFLSNGPGDPEPCTYAIETIRDFCERKVPLFGICLGHQLLGIASGGKSVKMKFGHHGANHPIRHEASKRVMISSQNHGFAVDEDSLPETLTPTYRSLFDGTLQGIARTDCPAFSLQGHPEASPGPHDVSPAFDDFVEMMRTARG
ncbi:glutamine-hydrolyzing carbamoyl-phosphate synthase small subunit [Thioalkalivibrio sp. ALJ1]|uniref:glutamine-hydrolyzing carbamoyl-phosphate synthase small subunit n=1 Tax=Thioalkalivibrio sp. ALJ1 TaxID=1158144 RepID=UPI000570BC7B|nr:glutamine-hydrolyzing carbamoyl-phosphate synthase small subunit [Thioalkalivibrio sp. ALJ1]